MNNQDIARHLENRKKYFDTLASFSGLRADIWEALAAVCEPSPFACQEISEDTLAALFGFGLGGCVSEENEQIALTTAGRLVHHLGGMFMRAIVEQMRLSMEVAGAKH